VPAPPPEIAGCILDSLAVAHRRTIHDAAALSSPSIEVVHLVGGGAQNTLQRAGLGWRSAMSSVPAKPACEGMIVLPALRSTAAISGAAAVADQ